MRIGILGTGVIATALVRGIAGEGHRITVSERSAGNAAALAEEVGVGVAANREVLDRSDVVVLGLMAEAASEVLSALRFRPDHLVVSLMAGASLEEVAAMVAPAEARAVMIPFPGIARGGSPVLALGDVPLVEAICGARNRVFALKNGAELDAALCAQAVLSPVARMVDDAARWLGDRVNNGEEGEAFLRMLVASSLDGMPVG
ncbi:NAD(P)-binding domain-containing protein, partial [Cribrihabitans sp. XS_ASV171]